MTRILHTGDTHLGYQQYHLPERRKDFLAAFQQVADDAVADGVDAVVHAGDLFHDRQPSLDDIMGALSVLRTLANADIPFLAVVGNHETKRSTQWLDLFETMGLATRLGSDPVTVGNVAVYGLDFVPRSKRDDLAYDYEPTDVEHAALVSHGLFEPFDFGDWDAREVLREASVEFDALLLGDDHEPKVKRLEEPHETWLTYPGSTERASSDEREARGYNLVTLEDGVDIRRRTLDTREFVFVDVELKPGEGSGQVRERIGQYDVSESVVVVTIEGEGDPVMPAGIEEYTADQGALATRISDHREVDDESDIDVSFADPDDAVRERVDDLGLSPAARDIDETVRASTVADSNVAETVQRRVRERLEARELDAFRSATDRADGDETKGGDGDGTDDQVTMEDYL